VSLKLHAAAALPWGKSSPCALDRKLGEPQNLSERRGIENCLPPLNSISIVLTFSMCEFLPECIEPVIRNVLKGKIAIKRIPNKFITKYGSLTNYNLNECNMF
jgi:hypothetical protein